MDGVHDLGGMAGFGRVEREPGEPVFHAAWERRLFGMMVVGTGTAGANVDEWRHAIERMDPARYLASTYWERWLDALERILIEKGFVAPGEIAARALQAAPPRRVESAGLVVALRDVIRNGVPSSRGGRPPAFQVGDRVVVRRHGARGHTRCPRYVRGAVGIVERCHGSHVLPDAHAHGGGESPEPLYNVRFAATELWGADADARAPVYLDLWETYLRPEP